MSAKWTGWDDTEEWDSEAHTAWVGTEGDCDVIVEEDEETVRVRVVLCWPDSEDHWNDRDYMDCPVHVYLEKPLDGRKVIWVDDEVELPLFVPDW